MLDTETMVRQRCPNITAPNVILIHDGRQYSGMGSCVDARQFDLLGYMATAGHTQPHQYVGIESSIARSALLPTHIEMQSRIAQYEQRDGGVLHKETRRNNLAGTYLGNMEASGMAPNERVIHIS